MTTTVFYLPVVTERYFLWFIEPMIKILSGCTDIHIVAPPQWLATGVTEHQQARLAKYGNINWHILDIMNHEQLRTFPADPEHVIGLVEKIAPDYVFCRSADVITPSRFPGKVKFMMEAIIPPFRLRSGLNFPLLLDGPRFYDQGVMPDLTASQRKKIIGLFDPIWSVNRARIGALRCDRDQYLREAGLPAGKKIIALPLNVEARNNFFIKVHSITPSNVTLIDELASRLDDGAVLALTEHPLNRGSDPLVDQSVEPIDKVVEKWRDRVFIVNSPGPVGDITASLIQYSDGVVICETKSFGHAAFFQKPIFRISSYASAEWLKVYRDFDAFQCDVLRGSAAASSVEEALLWFGFYWANNVFALDDPDLVSRDILNRFEQPVNAEWWDFAIGRLAS